jgi:hypothetical protein
MEIPLPEILSVGSAIAATSFGFTKFLFGRLEKIEMKFGTSIDKLTVSLSEIDKRLAVNSCIIDKFMEGCAHGNRRNLKAD